MTQLARLASLVSITLFVGCITSSTSETDQQLGGHDDDPVACPAIAIECPHGEAPVDLDGDGCALECGPVVCPAIAIECPHGEAPVDLDGDGCALECGQVACPAIAIECPEGQFLVDLDGDGCALECAEGCGTPPL